MKRLTVYYHGLKVGQLAEGANGLFFEYDPAFVATGHELSPLYLQLGRGVLARSSPASFQLPGLFEDSLPDRWGQRVMTEWFRRQGTASHAITPLLMLAYVGQRGMGALTYQPPLDVPHTAEELSLAELHQAAVVAERGGEIDLTALAEVGSSAGGARPKALIALPRSGPGPILAGAGDIPATHEAWIVKFDTSPDGTHGRMEEAYALLARAAGVDLPATRLLESKSGKWRRAHFAVRRFDRDGPERIHHHTLAAMCHLRGGDLDYETFLRVTRTLTKDEREVMRAFRRAAFNVLAGNRDDHGKNHGFLYRNRQWRLGPAYDLTFTGATELPERGMALGGERRGAGAVHLWKLADREGLDRNAVKVVLEEIQAALSQWPKFAEQAGLPASNAAEIAHVLRVPR